MTGVAGNDAGGALRLGNTPTELTIRHLRAPDDYRAMNAIANAVRIAQGENFYTTDEQFAVFYDNLADSDPRTDVFIAERDGHMLGYGRAGWHDEEDARIYEVVPFIDPATAGRDAFIAIVEVLEERLREIA